MVIVCINAVPFGSTGNIMFQVADQARKEGHTVYTFSKPVKGVEICDKWKPFHGYINTIAGVSLTARLSIYTGLEGVFARNETYKFLKQLDLINPDIIHLHNLHGWYINFSLLFSYIKKKNIRVIWTLHDCWAFTGHCPYFTIAKCDKWKMGCYNCPSFREYPQCHVDRSKLMWKLKRKWFTGVKNMTIVTPSKWLADMVKQSYLKDYPVRVVNNGIDLSVFKPTPSDFREKYHIPIGKFVLLGVAFGWGVRKGLDVFIELSKRLNFEKYQIVLVGTDADVDKQLPDNIISIHGTSNQKELAEIYTACDLFVNPTREENYPTVNMESIACGTPVLTFDTGGSNEIINTFTGISVKCDDINEMITQIKKTHDSSPFYENICCEQARVFSADQKYKEYIILLLKC